MSEPLDAAEVAAYLARLGVDVPPSPGLDSLNHLIDAHLRAIPFENLSIMLGEGIDLDPDHLFDKVIHRRRGGYCFELNGLFGRLLRSLHFDAHPILARVWYRAPAEVPAMTHTLHLVTLPEGRFLADVGFGGSTARVAVPAEPGAEVRDVDGIVRTRLTEHGLMVTRDNGRDVVDQFTSRLDPAYPSDFAVGSHYMSTHPNSHFTQGLTVALFTADGRDTLSGRILTRRRGVEEEKVALDDNASLLHALRETFGIDLGDKSHEFLEQIQARGA